MNESIIMEPDFTKVASDVLVIGVPNIQKILQDGTVSSSPFSPRLPEWLKLGDVKSRL